MLAQKAWEVTVHHHLTCRWAPLESPGRYYIASDTLSHLVLRWSFSIIFHPSGSFTLDLLEHLERTRTVAMMNLSEPSFWDDLRLPLMLSTCPKKDLGIVSQKHSKSHGPWSNKQSILRGFTRRRFHWGDWKLLDKTPAERIEKVGSQCMSGNTGAAWEDSNPILWGLKKVPAAF